MIEILRQMILGVTAAAIFSSVMLQFTQKSALQEIIKLAAGMVMILALLTPLSRISMPSFSGWMAEVKGSVAAQTGRAQEHNEQIAHSSIAGAVSGYIRDQAEALDMKCSVHTGLSEGEDGTMYISSVKVKGQAFTAEQREKLSALIERDCGVPRAQISFAEE